MIAGFTTYTSHAGSIANSRLSFIVQAEQNPISDQHSPTVLGSEHSEIHTLCSVRHVHRTDSYGEFGADAFCNVGHIIGRTRALYDAGTVVL